MPELGFLGPFDDDTEPHIDDEPHSYTKVVVLSAMQEAPCITDGGDELHYQSVRNKQVTLSSSNGPQCHKTLSPAIF